MIKPMKKILLTLLLPALLCTGAYAQGTAGEQTLTFRFVPGEDMFYIPWGGNDGELTRLYSLVDEYRAEIIAGRIPIHVEGYSSSMKSAERNRELAFTRANRVKSELITHKGLAEEHFVTKNHTTAYTAPDGRTYRDMVVVTLRIPAREQPKQEVVVAEPEPQPVVEEKPIPQPEPVVEPTPEPEPVVTQSRSWKSDTYRFAVRTNLLYDAFLVPNLGVEWRVNRHVGVQMNYGGSRWGGETGKVQKIWLVSPEVRWYLLDAKRFYVGASANVGEYNIYKGMLGDLISKDTGYQGKLWNAGLTVGYQLRLNRSFSLDFNLGLGYTNLEYDSFNVVNKRRVFKDKDKSKDFWGPTQGGISLVWTIGSK